MPLGLPRRGDRFAGFWSGLSVFPRWSAVMLPAMQVGRLLDGLRAVWTRNAGSRPISEWSPTSLEMASQER